MILPDVVLTSRANQQYKFSGLDSPEHWLDKNHGKSYAHTVQYSYNSRGFRDQEWPDHSQLGTAIWCLGDSFTVGIGSPVEHTWPAILSTMTGQRCINVSLDGASNNWISRKATRIINEINPAAMVIQWSYLERRENYKNSDFGRQWYQLYNTVKDPTWPQCDSISDFVKLPVQIQQEILNDFLPQHPLHILDEQLRVSAVRCTADEDVSNTLHCIDVVEIAAQQCNTTVIHSFVPDFTYQPLMVKIFQQLHLKNANNAGMVELLDYARDHHHYDVESSQHFVHQLLINFAALFNPQTRSS